MTSQIDAEKPTQGNAYTADVRGNFAIAADEITALQTRADTDQSDIATLKAQVATLQTQVATLQTQVANLQAGSFTGTWAWEATPITVTELAAPPPTKPSVGVDVDDPAMAGNLSITPADGYGSDFAAALERLQSGDGIMIWQRSNSANRMRYTVNNTGVISGSYFVLPISNGLVAGVEPADGVDVEVQLIFAA